MARYETTIASNMPPEQAFAYMADFSHAREWDPSVTKSARIGDGALEKGTQFDLVVRFGGRELQMRYEIAAYEEPKVVVLRSDKPNFVSRDLITVAPSGTGSTVHYDAVLELKGVARIFDVVLQRLFKGTGDKAAAGLRLALNR